MSNVVIIGTPRVLWGSGFQPNELPVLPIGYRYIQRWHEWTLAESPNKRLYYVDGGGVLYRQVRTPNGRNGLDDRETIVLPQKQLT